MSSETASVEIYKHTFSPSVPTHLFPFPVAYLWKWNLLAFLSCLCSRDTVQCCCDQYSSQSSKPLPSIIIHLSFLHMVYATWKNKLFFLPLLICLSLQGSQQTFMRIVDEPYFFCGICSHARNLQVIQVAFWKINLGVLINVEAIAMTYERKTGIGLKMSSQRGS